MPPRTGVRFAVGMVVPSLDFHWPPGVAGAPPAAALGGTIQLRKHHVGRHAVGRMVSRLLDGDRRPSQRVLVAAELVVRG